MSLNKNSYSFEHYGASSRREGRNKKFESNSNAGSVEHERKALYIYVLIIYIVGSFYE